MAPTTPTAAGVSRLMGFGYSIYSAVQAGASVTELWQAVRSAAGLEPGESLQASIFDMNYVAGLWRTVASSSVALNGAAATDAVTAEMTAWAPWTLGGASASISPSYQVRFGATFGEGEDAVTLWRSVSIPGSIEGLTVGDIGDMAMQSAQILQAGDTSIYPEDQVTLADIADQPLTIAPGSLTILRV